MMWALLAAPWLVASAADDIARAHELLTRLDCDEAQALGEQVAASPTADEAERREGMLIAGYCLAAAGRVGEAEERFRAAAAEDVRVEAGFPMERRVQYLLDAARADVLAERARGQAARRAALAEQVTLSVEAPRSIQGGERADFTVKIGGSAAERVRSVKLQFRRFDDPEFFTLPVRRGKDGRWRGEIGGVYTRSIRAYSLKWFVTASDDEGELRTFGTRQTPRTLAVAAGSEVAADLRARERLPPVTRVLFAGIGAPTATGLTAVAILYGATVAHDLDVGIGTGGRGGELLGVLGLMAVPVGMVAAEYATTYWLLDGALAWGPAIAVGAVTGLAEVALVVAVLRGANVPDILLSDRYAPEAIAAGAAVALGVVTASVAPLSLVLWDASQVAE